MTSSFKGRFGAIGMCSIGAILLASAAAWAVDEPPKSTEPPTKENRPEPVADDPKALEKTYIDPAAVIGHFNAALARLADENELASPEELAVQQEKEETCDLSTLSDPGKRLGAEAVFSNARKSVVIIGATGKGPRGRPRTLFATGFILSRDGAIATNYHVLASFRSMKSIGAMTSDGHVHPIQEVLAANKRNDLAILKLDATGLTPLPLATDAPIGATIYCLSHPVLSSKKTDNAFYAFTSGIVSGKFRLRLAEGKSVDAMTITADYAIGSSGGPILNENGAVVGMVCQTLPIFHSEEELDVQMVWKFSRPVGSLRALMKKSESPAN